MTLTGHLLDTAPDPGSPEWLATYSASQVAAICGLSRWDTPRSLHDTKRGIIPPQPQTSVQGRGHQFEPLIRGWVADQNPDWIVETTGTWAHAEYPWHTAAPDGIVIIDGEVELLEIKTAQDLHEWDGVPLPYLVQCMWQMDVTGARRCHVAACGPFELFNRSPRMLVVDYNADEAAMLRARVAAFDDDLTIGIQPPADHDSEADRLAVRYSHPVVVDDPGVDIPADIAEPYLAAHAVAAELDAAKKRTASALLEYLGGSKTARYGGVVIATRTRRGDQPPTLRAATGLADKAADILRKGMA